MRDHRLLEPALAAGLLVLDAVLFLFTDLSLIAFLVGAVGCVAAAFAGFALRTSVVALCVVTVGYLALAPITVGAAEYACMIPVSSAFAHGRRRLGLVSAAVFLALGVLVHVTRWGFNTTHVLLFLIIWAFLLSVAAAAGEAILRTRLYAQQRELEASRAHRREIAADLHDTVAHELARIALRADSGAESGPHRADIAVIAQAARLAAADLRRIMTLLEVDRSEVTEALNFAMTIDDCERRLRSSGFTVISTVEGDVSRIGGSLGVGLSRILVECTNNVERHGNPTFPIAEVFTVTDHTVEILVSNTPRGKGKARPGRGLAGIEERVVHLGGTLEILSEDALWTVHLAVPRAEKLS
ncbi:MAG: histidine kinase [Propionibacteriaceae bacterium]|nr:histidine kinase [Propionibacteriaceae bacterium]